MAQRLLRVLPDTHARGSPGRSICSRPGRSTTPRSLLSDEKSGKVEARVLPKAAEQTLAQLKAALARAVIAVDPDGDGRAAPRRPQATAGWCLGQENDGMASLWALLSASDAAGAFEWLTRLARGLGTDDPRGSTPAART